MTESLNLIPWRITRKGLMQEWGWSATFDEARSDAMHCLIDGGFEPVYDYLIQVGDACRDD